MPEIKQTERIPYRIGLLDADCIAYWASAGCDGMPAESAYRRVRDRIAMICDQIQTDDIRCYLTGENNFRNDEAKYQQYKGNRYDKDGKRLKPQPKWLAQCRACIFENYNTEIAQGQEADDLLSIGQIKCNASKKWHSIISSIDKDLLIVPGLHHDMNSGYIQEVDEFGTLFIDGKDKVRGTGLKFFYAQLLMGDSADWIPGLPKVTPWMKENIDGIKRLGGCGPKAAYHALNDCQSERELLHRVLDCYASYWDGDHFYADWRTGEQVYPEPEQALREQGRLLWMRREPDEIWHYNIEWHKEWLNDKNQAS